MRRIVTIATLAVLTVAALLLLAGPAAAVDVQIAAYTPSELRTGPMVPGSTWTFTYALGSYQTPIGSGVPATVYIMEHRTQRVAARFDTTLLPGAFVEDPSVEIAAAVAASREVLSDASAAALVRLFGRQWRAVVGVCREAPAYAEPAGPGTGVPLGVAADGRWPTRTREVASPWTFLMFTDGLFEVRRGAGPERLGVEGLRGLLSDAGGDA